MESNAATELVPLDSLWVGSRKVVWEIIPDDVESSFPIWPFFCAVLIVCIALSGKRSSILSDFIPSLPRPLPESRNITLLTVSAFLFAAVFSSMLTAGSLCYLSFLPPGNFISCVYVCLAILAAKSAIPAVVGQVSRIWCFTSFIRAFIILASAISVLIASTAFCIYLFPATAEWGKLSILISVLMIPAVLTYLYKVTLTLFYAGISPFYSFLYLCTVEIIPLCVIATMISRL